MATRILLICGSVRDGSTNAAVLRAAAQLAGPEVECERYVGLEALPHFNPDDDRGCETVAPPVAWINAADPAAPTGGADAPDSLREVLGYVGADIVDAACARVPVTRDLVAPKDGAISDSGARAAIGAALEAHVQRVADAPPDERAPMRQPRPT